MNTRKSHTKRYARTVLAALVVLPTAACGNSSDTGAGSDKTVRVAYLYPSTGPFAAYGEGIANDAKLAVDEINEADLGFTIDLNLIDDQCDTTKATTLTTKLVREKSADILFGSFCGAAAYASGTVATRGGIPVVVSGGQDPALADLEDTFITVPSTAQMTEEMAKKIAEAGTIDTVAVQYLSGDWGESIVKVLEEELDEAGIEITRAAPIDVADTNPLPFIAAARQDDPDAVVNVTTIGQMVPMVKAAAETSWDPQFLAFTTAAYPNFENQAGPAADGVIREFWFVNGNPNNNAEAKAYLSSYKEAYGAEPQYPSPSAYDGLKLVAQALQDAGVDSEGFDKDAFVEAMSSISYSGVVGEISFAEDGQLASAENIVFARSEGGELEIVDSLE